MSGVTDSDRPAEPDPALAGAFFAWVSAEPFWLSVGHGTSGTAAVVASADGCRATFVGSGFTRSTVELAAAPSWGWARAGAVALSVGAPLAVAAALLAAAF
jgi:hypothetical protein